MLLTVAEVPAPSSSLRFTPCDLRIFFNKNIKILSFTAKLPLITIFKAIYLLTSVVQSPILLLLDQWKLDLTPPSSLFDRPWKTNPYYTSKIFN